MREGMADLRVRTHTQRLDHSEGKREKERRKREKETLPQLTVRTTTTNGSEMGG